MPQHGIRKGLFTFKGRGIAAPASQVPARIESRNTASLSWHACDTPSRKSMLQQGGNQVVDYIRVFADNHPILRFGLPQRASVQQDRAVADRGDRLAMAVSLI